MHSKHIFHIIRIWLPLAVVTTGVCGLVYATVQQNYRQSLNDPQIQLAEDAARALMRGEDSFSLLPQTQIDIGASLAPYIIIYDEHMNPIAYSGTLNNEPPVPPPGVFAFTKAYGEDRLTWQPQNNVRTAIVMTHYRSPYGSGYVLAGRSMREVELRESKLGFTIGFAWMFILGATFIVQLFLEALEALKIRDF